MLRLHEKNQANEYLLDWLLLSSLCLIWGVNWVFTKKVSAYVGALDFTLQRSVIATVCLFAFAFLRRMRLKPVASVRLLVLGLFQIAGFQGLSAAAVMAGAVGKATVIVYMMPFWTMLLAWPLLQERLQRLQWLSVGVALSGFVYLVEPWRLQNWLSPLLALAGGFCWAVSAILAKRYYIHLKQLGVSSSATVITAWQMLFGTLALAVFWLIAPTQTVNWTPSFIGILLYASIFATALAWLIWLRLLERLSAGVASISLLATPVISVVLSRFQFNEKPNLNELSGMLLIGVGLVLYNLAIARKA